MSLTQDRFSDINIEVVYYIFRHGETKFSKTRTEYGKHEDTARILKTGIPVIKKLANEVKSIQSDQNFCSKALRCVQTVKIVSKVSGKQFIFDDRLNEFTENNFNNFKDRVKSLIDEVESSTLKTVIICTHGAVIAAFKHLLLNNSFIEKNLIDYPNSGVLVKIENRAIQETNFN